MRALQISPTVGSLAETTLSCEFQQQQQQPRHHDDDADDSTCDDDDDDDDELCYNHGSLDDDAQPAGGPVDVSMSRPLVATNCRRCHARGSPVVWGPQRAVGGPVGLHWGSPVVSPPHPAVSAARTHRCFNQHAIIAHQ